MFGRPLSGRPADGSVVRSILLTGAALFLSAAPAPRASFLAAQPPDRIKAPELAGGTDWLGVDAPLTLRQLRGKVVLLDFWTFCCVNCLQTLPEIERLERKYARQLVVVGVHSPKFDSERSSARVRQAMRRYEVRHPVVNDADRKLWAAYGVRAWPTLLLIDPEGYLVARLDGERPRNGEYLDAAIAQTVRAHRARRTLNEEPLPFQRAKAEAEGGPLCFPGRVLADEAGGRLFIADSTHHRLIVTDLAGKHLATVGTGVAGRADGPYSAAQFADPQGLCLRGDTLYVADRKNHLVRAVDLKSRRVRTVAGTGRQGLNHSSGGPARSTGLNSPWAVHAHGDQVFIANAGSYQLWALDTRRDRLRPFAGNGYEQLVDGPRPTCCLAQPTGLTADGRTLYFADSESSSVRAVALDGGGPVRTIVGKGLFDFGDRDGDAEGARLQHPLDLVAVGPKLYVVDTYNDKIKEADPEWRTCATLELTPTDPNEKGKLFDEPGGISHAAGRLYVADTNAHRIRIVDLATKKVSTLTLTDVEPPRK